MKKRWEKRENLSKNPRFHRNRYFDQNCSTVFRVIHKHKTADGEFRSRGHRDIGNKEKQRGKVNLGYARLLFGSIVYQRTGREAPRRWTAQSRADALVAELLEVGLRRVDLFGDAVQMARVGRRQLDRFAGEFRIEIASVGVRSHLGFEGRRYL